MRIALLSTRNPFDVPSADENALAPMQLAKALADRGEEVHLFAAGAWRRSGYRPHQGYHYHAVRGDVSNGSEFWVSQWPAMLYYMRATESVSGPFDVVHCLSTKLLPVLAKFKSGGRVSAWLSLSPDEANSKIITEQSLGVVPLPSNNGAGHGLHEASSNGQEAELSIGGWHASEFLDGVLVPMDSAREKIARQIGVPEQKVFVCPLGVNHGRFSRWVDQGKVKIRYGLDPLGPVILFSGELTRGQGPDLLVEAMFGVLPSHPRLTAVFAGDGPLLPYLQGRSRVLGLERATRFLGFVEDDELVDLLNASDIVCFPSRGELVSHAVLEAWSAGKPTIIARPAAPVFAQPGENSLVVEPSASGLAKAIGELLADREGALRMGQRAWQRASNEFAWEAIAERILQLYQITSHEPRLSVSWL